MKENEKIKRLANRVAELLPAHNGKFYPAAGQALQEAKIPADMWSYYNSAIGGLLGKRRRKKKRSLKSFSKKEIKKMIGESLSLVKARKDYLVT